MPLGSLTRWPFSVLGKQQFPGGQLGWDPECLAIALAGSPPFSVRGGVRATLAASPLLRHRVLHGTPGPYGAAGV